jgi:hypothetical protein
MNPALAKFPASISAVYAEEGRATEIFSRGLYRIDGFQVLRLFERAVPKRSSFCSTQHRSSSISWSLLYPCLRHDNLNFHISQPFAALDATRGGRTTV